MHNPFAAPAPQDQADGLRRLFSASRVRFVPVVSNPHVAFGGVLLERLCAAFAELGLHTLVVDAGENSPAPDELAAVDLGACVEQLSDKVSYLAARGLPMRFINSHGSAAEMLNAVIEAAPQADVVLLHASAAELCRVVARREVRPVLLADDHPHSVTHAYAGMKLLTQRAGLMVHSLLLGADEHSPRVERIAQQMTTCADSFLGAVLRDWAAVDPIAPPDERPTPELRHLARELLLAAPPGAALDAPADAMPLRGLLRPWQDAGMAAN
ncbi:MAG: flagellar biosynthesis protein [Burkholderiaceae bacterium]|nr:flagellar biosynthesis protein [Burkholderiaceae bacterium]MBT9503594.1 flagellar biosynthesis protein [Burkholderiaceae bacterium]